MSAAGGGVAPGADGVATLGGGGGHSLRTALHTISMSSKQFLRIAYLKTNELKGSKST